MENNQINISSQEKDKLSVEFSAKKLGELFGINHLNESLNLKGIIIPDYQRAYEWKSYHVKSLLNDTYEASKNKNSYLMGTIILHNTIKNEKEFYEIVDGQQRLITLTILLRCLSEKSEFPLLDSVFNNVKSFYYIQNTKKEIESFLSNKQNPQKENYFNFLINKLAFSVLIMKGANALDQAYTFFDGLNSKGKELSDFDLLKAHHLMFIPEEQESLARKHNDYWQSKDEEHKQLFSSVLRRIRMWSRGQERDSISERNDFYEFISAVEPSEIEKNEHLFNRYMQPNVFRSWHRENDEVILNMKYPQHEMESLLPMEIPQTIEGGDSFFLYSRRYHKMFETLFSSSENNKKSSAIKYVCGLANSIKNEKLSMAFKAVILLYYDKFGEQRLIEVATCTELIISKIRFNWGNVRPSPIRIETTLTWVKDNNIIPVVLNSTIPSHVVSLFCNSINIKNREHKDSFTLKNYKESISMFYSGNKSKIKNSNILEMLNTIYS